MQDSVIQWVIDLAGDPRIITIIISMLPILELRGAIPWGYFIGGLSLFESCFYSIIGNFMISIPIYIFFKYFTSILKSYDGTNRFIEWLFKRTRRKGSVVDRLKFVGLIIFVGIPLPMTGAWTGILAAYIFGLSLNRSLISIFIGLLISATIVSTLISIGLLIFQ